MENLFQRTLLLTRKLLHFQGECSLDAPPLWFREYSK